jgi:hypothetical protein
VLANSPAPPNGVSAAAFAMNLIAMRANTPRMQVYLDILIDRALDIARGGNGKVEAGGGAQVIG